jgi:hypothetical protein
MSCDRRKVLSSVENRRRWVVLALAGSGLWVGPRLASGLTTDTWTDGSDNWSVSGNWSAGVPGSGVVADIGDSDGVSRTVTYDYAGPAVSLDSLTVDLTGGTGSATNTLSISANNLTTSNYEYIGYAGSGTVNQTGGMNTINGSADLGQNSGSSGTYNLSGSGVITGSGNFFVGAGLEGVGTFNQSGGMFNLTSTTAGVTLGLGEVDGSGTYNLSGGSLMTSYEEVGGHGSGTFIQTGGTNTVTNTLSQYVSFGVGGNSGPTTGSYTLSGTGSLTSMSEEIGTTGTFTQNGGTNTITGQSKQFALFDIGNSGTTGGVYNLNGGTLSADALTDDGLFAQSGGQATLSAILGGQVTLTGGTLTLVSDGFTSPRSVLKSFSAGGTGTLNLYVGGDSQGINYDWVESQGTMSLGGTLDLDLTPGFVPNVGDQFTLMSVTNGSISGQFSQLTSDDPGLAYTVSYGASDNIVEVTITEVPEPVSLAGFILPSFLLFRRRREVVG